MAYRYIHFGSRQYDDYLAFIGRFRTDPAPTPEDLRRKWRIFDNPYHGYLLLAYTDTDIAATLTLSGRRLGAAPQHHFCFELGDGWTAQHHRRQGLFHELGRQARELAFSDSRIEFIIGAPNPQAEPNWRKHQYRFTKDDGSTLIILPQPFNLVRRRLLGSNRDPIENIRAFTEKRLRTSQVLTELSFAEYESRTRVLPRMNDSDPPYLSWRFETAPDGYRYFNLTDSANGQSQEFLCAIRTIRLGPLPFLVVSEYFLNGVRDDSPRKLAWIRAITNHAFRNHAGVCLNSRFVGRQSSRLSRTLHMAADRYLEHRPQPICYLFRDPPTDAQADFMNGLRRVFQLSDCDVG